MERFLRGTVLTTAVAWLGCSLSGLVAAQDGGGIGAPHWAQVEPLLERHCVRCHRAGGVAPMRLDSYETARPWARAIARAVESGSMPPWFAAPEIGAWRNDPRLQAEEIDQIIAWVSGGAVGPSLQKGRSVVRDSVPETPEWRIGSPDLVWISPRTFSVPESGVVDYVYVRLPDRFSETRWLQAIEARPSQPQVVHHIDVFTCAAWCRQDLEPGVPTIFDDTGDEAEGTGEGAERSPTVQRIAGDVFALGDEQLLFSYLPGGDPWVFPQGAARQIPAGTELMLNVHYTPDGESVEDRIEVAMRFADGPPKVRMLTFGVDNYSLQLPAGAAHHRVDAEMRTGLPLTLTALTPHMHFRGSAFEFQVALAESPERWRTVLRLPRYDFNWQLTYRFAEPLQLPAGSRLRAIGWFDNSVSNPFNPDPAAAIGWGRQSTDEMMSAWIEVALPQALDATELQDLVFGVE